MAVKAVVFALGLAVLLGGCGESSNAADDVPNPVTGVITKVGDDYIVLKTESGEKIRFDNADTDATVEHLQLHRKQKLPVTVTHEPNGDRLIARRIADAPES